MIRSVDTNVAVVANRKAEQASAACIRICVARLKAIIDRESQMRLAVDDGWRIIREYMGNLNSKGQPGVGDAFLQWVLVNQASERIVQVHITPREEDDWDFEEFPRDKRLTAFDRADRKWVAVAIAHSEHPPILQATDRKWRGFQNALQENGVEVEFLCESDFHE